MKVVTRTYAQFEQHILSMQKYVIIRLFSQNINEIKTHHLCKNTQANMYLTPVRKVGLFFGKNIEIFPAVVF